MSEHQDGIRSWQEWWERSHVKARCEASEEFRRARHWASENLPQHKLSEAPRRLTKNQKYLHRLERACGHFPLIDC